MNQVEEAELRRIKEDLRENHRRTKYLNELFAKGEVSANRLNNEQLAIKIMQMRKGAFNRTFLFDERIEAFARATGNTYEGARIMIAADERYGTYTFVRGSAQSQVKAGPAIIKELREAGHSPKPEFIKIGSGPDGMFKPSTADFSNNEIGPAIEHAIDEGWIQIDSAGYMVDSRERLPSGAANIGFGKRYVSDVDLASVYRRGGSSISKCDNATYSEIIRSNSWFLNQKCSCTHGAFINWGSKKPTAVAKKAELTAKHLNDKSYGHRGLDAGQIGRSEFLRPPRRIDPQKLKTAKFELLTGEPLIGFIDGRIINTFIDRIILDIVSLKNRRNS